MAKFFNDRVWLSNGHYNSISSDAYLTDDLFLEIYAISLHQYHFHGLMISFIQLKMQNTNSKSLQGSKHTDTL